MAASELLAEDEQRPIVIVSVGTDHHRFDRLIQWTEEFAATRPEVAFVVQRGTSRSPKGVTSQELIPHQEIQEMFRRAVVVVSHGGPSTVMDARGQGRLPIVVPRNPEFGEHVDGHQMRFATHLDTNGIARVANTQDEFVDLLSQALENPADFAIDIADVIVPPGVLRLGQVLDEILGVTTPIDGVRSTSSDPATGREGNQT
jgi:UDP-N-acetylglucosamine transferase subunit ALG13